MPFQKRRADLRLSPDHQTHLEAIRQSRSEPLPRVERARILLLYAQGTSVSAIARALQTNRPKIERCLDKALQLGALAALDDLPRSGRPARIPPEARAWLVSVACQKPQDLGYPEEWWTTRLLASHIRAHCDEAGHPSLARLARGTVSKILARQKRKGPKIKSYLECRDPDFERKMAQVLLIYKQVPILREQENDAIEEPGGGRPDAPLVASLSHDEKPGIQAIGSVAPDLPPPDSDKHPSTSRDYESKRHRTLTLLAGLDLLTGQVHRAVVPRHRSREFVAFLQQLDRAYPPGTKLRVVLDNHSAHVSQETRAYLATVANRFEFIFTPTHGSWLNLVESFFWKSTRTLLRGMRVQSKGEFKQRIEASIDRLNEDPVVDRYFGIGLLGSRQFPSSLPPSAVPLNLRPLPSLGVTRLPRYSEPLRHPADPSGPSRVPGGRVRTTARASRVAPALPLHACHRPYPGGGDRLGVRPPPSSGASPVAGNLPRTTGGSASASCFARPARRSLAFRSAHLLNRPRRPFSLGVLPSTSFPQSTIPKEEL